MNDAIQRLKSLDEIVHGEKSRVYAVSIRRFEQDGYMRVYPTAINHRPYDAIEKKMLHVLNNFYKDLEHSRSVETLVAHDEDRKPYESFIEMRALMNKTDWSKDDRDRWEQLLIEEIELRLTKNWGEYSRGFWFRPKNVSAAVGIGEWECEMRSAVGGMLIQRIEDELLRDFSNGWKQPLPYYYVTGTVATPEQDIDTVFHAWLGTPGGNIGEMTAVNPLRLTYTDAARTERASLEDVLTPTTVWTNKKITGTEHVLHAREYLFGRAEQFATQLLRDESGHKYDKDSAYTAFFPREAAIIEEALSTDLLLPKKFPNIAVGVEQLEEIGFLNAESAFQTTLREAMEDDSFLNDEELAALRKITRDADRTYTAYDSRSHRDGDSIGSRVGVAGPRRMNGFAPRKNFELELADPSTGEVIIRFDSDMQLPGFKSEIVEVSVSPMELPAPPTPKPAVDPFDPDLDPMDPNNARRWFDHSRGFIDPS